MCNPKGRSCLERWASQSFNCSDACHGIFVDIEWEEDDILTGESGPMTNVNGKGKVKGDLLNRVIFARLVEEYISLRRNHTQHFRYAAEEKSTHFGEYLSFLQLFVIY